MTKLAVVLAMVFVLSACASSGGGPSARSGGIKPYPLDTCLVTGTSLGSMGDPYVKVYGNQEIKFCCEPCVDEFEENQAKFLGMLPK